MIGFVSSGHACDEQKSDFSIPDECSNQQKATEMSTTSSQGAPLTPAASTSPEQLKGSKSSNSSMSVPSSIVIVENDSMLPVSPLAHSKKKKGSWSFSSLRRMGAKNSGRNSSGSGSAPSVVLAVGETTAFKNNASWGNNIGTALGSSPENQTTLLLARKEKSRIDEKLAALKAHKQQQKQHSDTTNNVLLTPATLSLRQSLLVNTKRKCVSLRDFSSTRGDNLLYGQSSYNESSSPGPHTPQGRRSRSNERLPSSEALTLNHDGPCESWAGANLDFLSPTRRTQPRQRRSSRKIIRQHDTRSATAIAAPIVAADEPSIIPSLSKSKSVDDAIISWKNKMSEIESSTNPTGLMMNSDWLSSPTPTTRTENRQHDVVTPTQGGLKQSRSTDDVTRSWKAKMSALEKEVVPKLTTMATATCSKLNSSWPATTNDIALPTSLSRDGSWGGANLEDLFVSSSSKGSTTKKEPVGKSRADLLRKAKSTNNMIGCDTLHGPPAVLEITVEETLNLTQTPNHCWDHWSWDHLTTLNDCVDNITAADGDDINEKECSSSLSSLPEKKANKNEQPDCNNEKKRASSFSSLPETKAKEETRQDQSGLETKPVTSTGPFRSLSSRTKRRLLFRNKSSRIAQPPGGSQEVATPVVQKQPSKSSSNRLVPKVVRNRFSRQISRRRGSVV